MKLLLETIYKKCEDTHDIGVMTDLKYMCRETLKTDIPLAVEYSVKLSEECEKTIPMFIDRDLNKAKEMMNIHKSALMLSAQNNHFDSFLQYLEFGRSPDKRFYLPRRKVLRPIVNAFQEVADGKLDLLTVSQPKIRG